MKKYEQMTKKELMGIAKVYGIKGRSKMNKRALIEAIMKKKDPLEKMKKFEENLKNEKLPQALGKNFVQILPKEPGTVFVHWEVKKAKSKELTLRIKEGRKSIIEIPLMSETGNGYMSLEEGKRVHAEIGAVKNGRFGKIAESPEIVIPVSKPSRNKTVIWTDIRKKSGNELKNKVPENVNELKEKSKKTEKTAKTVKYIRVPKER